MPIPTTTIIIPTYNRPKELTDCLHSLLRQTVRPDELIIVDDGDLGGMPLEEELARAGVACRYIKKDRPGLTASRNAGIRAAGGDIVFFLDDDVVLYPDYLEEILKVYETDRGGNLGGVGGIIANDPPAGRMDRLKYLLGRLFLVTGPCEGRLEPSGFCTDFGASGRPLEEVTEVDFLPGGVCSYKKGVFEDFSFCEDYRGYGLGEDKDFSCRASRRYRLLMTPAARLDHFHAPNMRPDYHAFGRMYILHTYRFFRSFAHRGWWSWPLFYYAVFGYLFIRILVLLAAPRKRHLDRITGVLSGLGQILTGKAGGLIS